MCKGASRVQPEIFLAITVAETILERHGLDLRIESLLDGHNQNHHLGYEVDLGVPADQSGDIASDLQLALLGSYMVNSDGARIHVVFIHV
jgi:hypothetical protein